MTTWIALLRAVNVAGHAPIRMADLRSLAAELGFAEPRTLRKLHQRLEVIEETFAELDTKI